MHDATAAAMQLKKLHQQVIVITGASSGIGLTTARMAARAGAKVVLTARDENTLRKEVENLRAEGLEATFLAGDVAEPETLQRVGQHAEETYGRIDTWVNNAGVAIFGLAEHVALEDMRRLFDVTFWGVVHGTRAALPRLKRHGGTLINLGSIESEIGVPYHSAYSAAKHAVKGYTDTVRMEIEKERAPVVVTLVKPSAIDTPFFEHGKNYMAKNPAPPPPVYAPELVARTILHCAQKPVREITVGGSGRVFVALTRRLPRTADRLFEATMFRMQQTDRATRTDQEGSLRKPGAFNGQQRGQFDGHVRESSYSTALALMPAQKVIGVALLGAAVVGAASLLRGSPMRTLPRVAHRKLPTLARGRDDGRAHPYESVEGDPSAHAE
ncbi:MAG: yxnA [Myxococcaceae bacterium]|nr:yxnA [Myxococcaceae bacterium]